MCAPKLFISYSWSSIAHEQWVLDLAIELRESGVDVILDKWELKEGHDTISFMEKMVSDSSINKVAIISDEFYAEKANGRSGGVGTETQIISKEIYEQQQQEKFVAVLPVKDQNGKPYLPIYYSSRMYIDLSEPDKYPDNFEKLLRWIFDKPLYIKPELGKRPSFLSDNSGISLGTTALYKRCVDALKNDKSYAYGAFDEYCSTFTSNLERFRISNYEGEYDEHLVSNIDLFVPYRNEVIQLFICIAQYSHSEQFSLRTHRFLESLIVYKNRPENISRYRQSDFDNFKFIMHELFIYCIAIFIKYERFSFANFLLEQQYFIAENEILERNKLSSFGVFRENLPSLERRNTRLGLRRLSLSADLLKERCVGTGLEFRHLMQADFIAYIRADLQAESIFDRHWWPDTLLYLGHFDSSFEVFSRSVSKKYFEKAKVLLGINDKEEVEILFKRYKNNEFKIPSWDFQSFTPEKLLNYELLATKP